MDRGCGPEKVATVSTETVEIRITRSQVKACPSPEISVYRLDYKEGMTLHSALESIYKLMDPSLAFRPYRCGKGTCMSCIVSVNGTGKQACTTLLNPGDSVLVEPYPSLPIVRDLVTITSKKEMKR